MQEITLKDTTALDAMMERALKVRGEAVGIIPNGKMNTGDAALNHEVAEKLWEAQDKIDEAKEALSTAYNYMSEAKRLVLEARPR